MVKKHPECNLAHIDIEKSSWAKSLFQRMGFVRRQATTSKVQISEEVRQDIQLTFNHSIVSKIEKYKIPPSMVINLDQTPSKFVPSCNKTLAQKGSKTVAIAGSTDKRTITATFAITLDGNFLPIQLIYKGKTKQSLPRVTFPPGFLVTANEKHYSNEKESLELIKGIIDPYLEGQRKALDLEPDHPGLVTLDVFKGQTTPNVLQKFQEKDIKWDKVPANLTWLFQPLDVQGGPNGYAKKFMKDKFMLWYADQITQSLEKGIPLDMIDVDMKLTTLKPLHASWMIELYNHMTSPRGREVCLKGWEVSGIKGAVEMGLANLPPLDPFHDIDPLATISTISEAVDEIDLGNRDMYITETNGEDSDDEFWEDDDGNVFDMFQQYDDDEDE